MEQLASITVTRPRGLVGALRKFRILCDGVEVAQISNDSSSQIQLAAGVHTIQVKCDWLGGPPLEVTLQPGETRHLVCGSADDVVQLLLATLFLRNSYLRPRVVTAAERESQLQRPRPAWGRALLYCVIWGLILASLAFAIMILTPSTSQSGSARAEKLGQVVGSLLVSGWFVILIRAYSKRT
jgi:hypothetical protein